MQRKNMLIRISAMLLICCLMFCGCIDVNKNPNTNGSISSNTEPAEPPKPINMLESYAEDSAPIIVDIGDGKVMLVNQNFTKEDNEFKDAVVQIVDIVNDTVCCRHVFKEQLEPANDIMQNGIWLLNKEDELLYKLDDELNIVKEIPLSDMSGVFSKDFKKYYYLESRLLYALDLETEEKTYIELPYSLRLSVIYGFDLETNCLHGTATACNEEYTLVINVDDKKIQMFTNELGYIECNGSTYCGNVYDEEAGGFSYYCGNLNSGDLMYFLRDKNDKFDYNNAIGSSRYLIGLMARWNGGTGECTAANTRICRFADNAVEYCDLDSMGFEDGLRSTVYLSEGNYLVGSSIVDSDNRLIVIDTDLLNFGNTMPVNNKKLNKLIDNEAWEENEKMLAIPEVSDELSEARKYADEIEKKYGVTILLSNQCEVPTRITDYFGFEFVTTDKQEFYDSERERITEALNVLDIALSQYPKDFFKYFKNDLDMGGLRYMLVGKITGDEFDVAGFATSGDEWYDAVVDVSLISESTYHHETWHDIENLCIDCGVKCFEPESWNKLNPKDFEYSLSYYTENKEHDYELFDSSTETEFYFIDDYAMTDAREDRARLFEYVMTGDFDDIVLSSSKAFEKFKVMTDAMRDTWGEAAWESSQWEESLKAATD